MSRLLDRAIEQARRLPEERQDEIAQVIMGMASAPGEALLTPEQWREVRRRLVEPRDYAADRDVAAFFAKRRG